MKIRISDYQGAMQYFEFGLIDNPKSPILYNNIGNIYFIKKYYSKAEQHYTTALISDQKNAVLYTNRALAKMKSGKYRDAIKDLQMATQLNSKDHYSKSLLAQSYLELKEYEKSLELINEAIKESNTHYAYYITRSKCVQYLNNELLAALEDIDKAIQLAPDRAELFTLRSEIRSQIGDINGSKSDLKQAKSLSKMDFLLDSEKQPIIFL